MFNELKQKYKAISLNDKRNELNKELLALLLLTNDKDIENYYNYDSNTDELVSEDEFLTEIYMQIIELRSSIMNSNDFNTLN